MLHVSIGGDCFSDGGLHFQVGGAPWGGHRFSWGWRGGLNKIVGWWWGAHPHAPTLWEALTHTHTHTHTIS